MQLKELKLAGFKSFVDPTVIPFPSQLVAVVGPNGCGKSNVIDAVRWVMGESSAKNLRGESMSDVIFNGSTNRKAVGQASVELVFDNSLGRLTGQFGSYQEISVKRVVSRDGESSYYLNGTRCRRKDITDIFLGTGAGARGYSIIGQGTISRIVEARPEELRTYLEEAAGVSKYKERRRETLLRISHTRENLARVADIRDELDKQLQRLERQAKAAERYKILKTEERLYKAQIMALKWRDYSAEQAIKKQEIAELLAAYEQHQANAAETYKQSIIFREKLHEDNEGFQQIQSHFYHLATEIARQEEAIQQNQREKIRLQKDQQQIQNDWQAAHYQIAQDSEFLNHSETTIRELGGNLLSLQEELLAQEKSLQAFEAEKANWNSKNEALQAHLNQSVRELQLKEMRSRHLAERRQQILLRLEKINEEDKVAELDLLTERLNGQKDLLSSLVEQLKQKENNYQISFQELESTRQKLSEVQVNLHQMQDELYELSTKQASISALQQAALGQVNQQEDLTEWPEAKRVIESLQVDKEWQYACELLLGEVLQGLLFDSLDEIWPQLKNIELNTALFLSPTSRQENQGSFPRLLDKISGSYPACWHHLEHVYAAMDLTQALSWLPQLNEQESIITPDGYWLAKNWIKIAKSNQQNPSGLLVRQEELIQLNEKLSVTQARLDELKSSRDRLQAQLQESEQILEKQKQELSKAREEFRILELDIGNKEQAFRQAQQRRTLLLEEKQALLSDLEALAEEDEELAQELQSLQESSQGYEVEHQRMLVEKKSWEDSLHEQQQRVRENRALLHQTQLNFDREKIKIQQLSENIKRDRLRLNTLEERLEELSQQLTSIDEPAERLVQNLNDKIAKHRELDEHLNHARDNLNALNKQVEEFEALSRAEEKRAHALQEKIQQIQMQEQALAVRANGVIESLTELGLSLKEVLDHLPEQMTTLVREQDLAEINEKIKRLGAINLAAIEEYEVESKRKQHLDEQYRDLTEALATLDAAIEKMDKETLQLLKTTFNDVNAAFQALFPRLFGGGRAMLELTCDNLLEAGIVVMAQPPGKRNSTIHLLSGGEKAMTAVALVFAIFQLNPSPFCMLDEVDAPLDDVNVGRFCTLVKEMSQFVQFLFITHNKVTMELADHLIGVTMREPGVSRIVAVDVEQALSMSSS
ncbi:chromosome segregation protein SMC [Legionella jordanis]|uniref:Chromosome partition protein Smc n=1 Tax=Legionella jordanis TaxID=456 RepID=A0A0W0VDN2_9GAMM|nr:chromosome segregation protein SMC [Legionella jordanis]KTD18200.1 chromosome partition protein smc [Legionella jordanis]RMX01160.1 chromosome segregation protein SMC [Legionella jordanis]RMX21390.1 chromosome segregation protein SMC [Legionella jordanis]VEH13707.1 chromosome partition protein smc [Legionella jordanis]